MVQSHCCELKNQQSKAILLGIHVQGVKLRSHQGAALGAAGASWGRAGTDAKAARGDLLVLTVSYFLAWVLVIGCLFFDNLFSCVFLFCVFLCLLNFTIEKDTFL